MESSPTAMLKFLLPKTPFILKTALAHTLSFSETSSKWDLKTELTIRVLRDMLGPNHKLTPITKLQDLTTRDPGVKGPVWVCWVSLEVPVEDDVRQAVFSAVREMGTGEEKWDECAMRGVQGEWHGGRAGVRDAEPEPPNLSEKEKYQKLMGEVRHRTTVLYFHGGAMYLLDPATYRNITGKIARLTGGRVFSVRYRLAPQHAFPAALLDALMSYLSLLYPPPGAPHDPVAPSDIVFAGDSAGGMLASALLQLLLHLHRTSCFPPTLRWYGNDVEVPLPAGVALTSPWLDATRSLPSIESLAKYDYLPPPSHTSRMTYPPDSAWPTSPPRADLYAESSALCHPLVSPLAARDWRSSPPVFIGVGEEMMRDEAAVLARRLHAQGGSVRWREWEAMPHCFAMMIESLPSSAQYFDEFARFCVDVVEGKVTGSDGARMAAKTGVRGTVEVERVTGYSDEEVEAFMREGRGRIERKFLGKGTETRPMI
ncbi:hypothetical protein BU23DRAFT_525525 [Bimuria novae-zelandiae CBS 107.79]|uniref:Alpha/beta hydrolase fold-3 domain-containing protein n=1 Tax=Bimuria novae-zelandiae CBS 107.79 TaxID=1447943 RepID=A0A6A5VN26_9PLEO|nr:hypothetical protein BU23DRAFT_525525 [Bimuria novae-zelandiae CBS 107.79]